MTVCGSKQSGCFSCLPFLWKPKIVTVGRLCRQKRKFVINEDELARAVKQCLYDFQNSDDGLPGMDELKTELRDFIQLIIARELTKICHEYGLEKAKTVPNTVEETENALSETTAEDGGACLETEEVICPHKVEFVKDVITDRPRKSFLKRLFHLPSGHRRGEGPENELQEQKSSKKMINVIFRRHVKTENDEDNTYISFGSDPTEEGTIEAGLESLDKITTGEKSPNKTMVTGTDTLKAVDDIATGIETEKDTDDKPEIKSSKSFTKRLQRFIRRTKSEGDNQKKRLASRLGKVFKKSVGDDGGRKSASKSKSAI